MALRKVLVMCDCPTTDSKLTGLYFLADTVYPSMLLRNKH